MKEVKSTKDYKQFKKLEGNRGISQDRVNKIIKSIQRVGYITSPIIVNEKMEVIDGQGRLEALQALHMPVDYIVEPGIGIDECISMNINKTNWTMNDYINSYAERGNENYVRLKNLMDKYPTLSTHCFATALLGTGRFGALPVANGDLVITEDDYNDSIGLLDYVIDMEDSLRELNVRSDTLIKSILFITRMPEVDLERLKDKIINEGRMLKNFKTIPQCIQALEELYNYKLVHPIYIYTEYRKMMRENGLRGTKILKAKKGE